MAAVLPLPAGAHAQAADEGAAVRPRARSGFAFGKYREIIIAVAFFLLFDIGVLVLNFYTSFKIDQDTVAINLAGRQRYVSQRIARTLLELDAARIAGRPFRPETIAELRAGTKIWQASHQAFKEGATLPGVGVIFTHPVCTADPAPAVCSLNALRAGIVYAKLLPATPLTVNVNGAPAVVAVPLE